MTEFTACQTLTVSEKRGLQHVACSSREVSNIFFASHPLAMGTPAWFGVAGPGRVSLHRDQSGL